MHIGIMGLPGAGKTTLFNVLAGAHAQVGGYGAAAEPNRAVVKVPDERLDRLSALFAPKKTTPAEVQYVDVAGLVQGSAAKASSAAFLGHLRQADVLVHVVRAFAGPLGEPTPLADLETGELELALADLTVIEKRQERLERDTRSAPHGSPERAAAEREQALLADFATALQAGRPLRDLEVDPADEKLIRGFGFLTLKPMLVVMNTAEPDEGLAAEARARLPWRRTEVVSLPGQLEMELAELDPAEAQEFMAALGVSEPGAPRVIQISYRLAGLLSFFTAGPDEVRAWTIPLGSTAVDAAAAIHSDLARGFIRAEVVRWDDLLAAGSMAEARKRGQLRSEGRAYVVQDGDVIEILFNVGRG